MSHSATMPARSGRHETERSPFDPFGPGCSSDSSVRATPDLVDRLIAHDEAAYEELVRTHGPRMLSVATRYLPSRDDAEDALQESFASVVRSISGFNRASRIETWLHRIVVNSALMILRRRRRRPEMTLDASALEGGAASPWRRWPAPSAHDAVAKREARRLVRLSVDRLPESQRSVLLLRDVEDLEPKEIALLLDLGLSTVKVRLHRARHSLADALAPEFSESA